jgi:hypothetical protein
LETVAVSVNSSGESVGINSLPTGQTAWRNTLVPVGVPVGTAQIVDSSGALAGVMIDGQTSTQFSQGVWLDTPDGGSTWHEHQAPVGGVVTDAGGLWLVGGVQNQTIYLSSDAGNSWQLANIPVTIGGSVAFGPVQASGQGVLLTATKPDSDQVQVVTGSESAAGWHWSDGATLNVGGQYGAGATTTSSLADGVLWVVSPTYSLYLVTVATGEVSKVTADGLPSNGTFTLYAASSQSAVAIYTSTTCADGKSACSQTSGMLATTNGGQDWTAVADPLAG